MRKQRSKTLKSPGRKRPVSSSSKIDTTPLIVKLEELEARKKEKDFYIKLAFCLFVGILGLILMMVISASTGDSGASDAHWALSTETAMPAQAAPQLATTYVTFINDHMLQIILITPFIIFIYPSLRRWWRRLTYNF
jgi:hypothetical protein